VSDGNTEVEVVELPTSPEAAFAGLMDALAPETDNPSPAEGGAEAPAPAAGDGSPAAPAEGAGAAGAAAPAPNPGDAGKPAVPGAPGADGAQAGGEQPGEPAGAPGPATPAPVVDWGAVSAGINETIRKQTETEAIEAVRTEFGNYIEAVQKPPVVLKGTKVPGLDSTPKDRLDADGMMLLRDTEEAAEWQEHVKYELNREIGDRAARLSDERRDDVERLHSAADLFQANPELLSDKALADGFMESAKHLLKKNADGKPIGFIVPTENLQAIVDSVKSRLAPAAPAAAAPAAAPSPQQQRATEQPRNPQGQFQNEQPQPGLTSQAGSSGDAANDFDALFGTLGFQPGTIRI